MLPPTHVIFACDESGAKGYADQQEKTEGEVGVFVGILMPQECVAEKMPIFEAVRKKYANPDGKLHIADLSPELQEKLRLDVFQAIRESRLACFWYAVHVSGFHEWYLHCESMLAQARAARRSPVKLGSPRPNPESLHIALFRGLYSRLIAFCEERRREELHVEIRLDKVDEPIKDEFEKAAQTLFDLDHRVKRSGFDPVSGSVVHGEVFSTIKLPDELNINVLVRSIKLTVVDDQDALVLAADVLANSLAHLFHNREDDERYRPLNIPEAVAKHPLAAQLDSFWNWGGGDVVADGLFRHPKDPS